MEREQFLRLKRVLRQAACEHHSNVKNLHSDSVICQVALWASLHQKPISWAAVAKHWPGDLRPKPLPSQSCMSRRLRHPDTLTLMQLWQKHARRQLPSSDIKIIDGRPLVIGGCSKDPDAGFGYAASTKAKGYKLHWVVDALNQAIDGWMVMPMNYPEQHAAQHLIEHLPDHTAYVLADNNYDSNQLYEQAGVDQGVQWMALPRKKAKGLGRHHHSDFRLAVQPFLRSPGGRQRVSRHRIGIEQVNGRIGCSAVGLSHLPYHARRLHRVRVWVGLKILILTDHQFATAAKTAA
jgi:hypothetical protein